jgi:Fe-S cluster assembly ATP-binding protein
MLVLKNLMFSVHDTESNAGATGRTIIDNISFTFEKGKFYAITGQAFERIYERDKEK